MKVGDYHLGFIGFGHLAQVMFKAIDQAKLIPRSRIRFVQRDPAKMVAHQKEFGITATSLETLVRESEILLLCVQPFQARVVLEELARLGVEEKMIVTVLAGLKLSFYQKYLGAQVQILRAMPNIASDVGEGMTLFTFGSHAEREFKSLAHLMFSSMGEVAEVEEKWMDIGTAIAGSGPGFVFRLIEAFARAGVKQGLSYEIALKMSAQTFAGAARLILKGAMPEKLIHQIATPKGTTEAGFKAMSETHMEKDLQAVVEASARRSREISEQLETP